MTEIFRKLIDTSDVNEKEEQSVQWFRDKAQEVENVDSAKIIRNNAQSTEKRIRAGHLYLYRYNPKYKKELPYYDRYPVVFPFKKMQEGFLGLNLHYLPHKFRAVLMDALYDFVAGRGDTTRVRVNEKILENTFSLRFYKPCIKHYLLDYVETRFLHVDYTEWDIALFLPLQRFMKASEARIYRESISKIRDNKD